MSVVLMVIASNLWSTYYMPSTKFYIHYLFYSFNNPISSIINAYFTEVQTKVQRASELFPSLTANSEETRPGWPDSR